MEEAARRRHFCALGSPMATRCAWPVRCTKEVRSQWVWETYSLAGQWVWDTCTRVFCSVGTALQCVHCFAAVHVAAGVWVKACKHVDLAHALVSSTNQLHVTRDATTCCRAHAVITPVMTAQQCAELLATCLKPPSADLHTPFAQGPAQLIVPLGGASMPGRGQVVGWPGTAPSYSARAPLPRAHK